jgi:putative MATE family efflux protein
VSLFWLDGILRFFGASDATLPYAHDYMVIILLGNVVTHLHLGLNAMLRAAGKPRQAMYLTIATVIINAILDPLFIYTFEMGIRGAAVATILSQALALLCQCWMFSRKTELVHFERSKFHLESPIVKGIISIGISPFSMNACACLVVIFINNSLMHYGGDMAVGGYGIANRIVFIFVMITLGVCQGMQPITGYNYGAQNYNRMLEALKLATIAGTIVCAVGFVLAMLCPRFIASMFTSDPSLIEHSVVAMQYIMALFIIIGAQMVITNFFQSIGSAKVSIFLSLSRQLIFLVPMIIILPQFMGLKGVWLAMPLSDGIAAIMAYAMIAVYIRKVKREKPF